MLAEYSGGKMIVAVALEGMVTSIVSVGEPGEVRCQELCMRPRLEEKLAEAVVRLPTTVGAMRSCSEGGRLRSKSMPARPR